VRHNAQLAFVELLPDDDRLTDGQRLVRFGPTWLFLYHRDGDTVRSELSLARSVSESGALLKWSERLRVSQTRH